MTKLSIVRKIFSRSLVLSLHVVFLSIDSIIHVPKHVQKHDRGFVE